MEEIISETYMVHQNLCDKIKMKTFKTHSLNKIKLYQVNRWKITHRRGNFTTFTSKLTKQEHQSSRLNKKEIHII